MVDFRDDNMFCATRLYGYSPEWPGKSFPFRNEVADIYSSL